MSTILLTYGTRPIAQRIAKALSPYHHIILASHEAIPSVLSNTYRSIPNPANPVFAHEMLKLSLDQGIDFILPLGLAEIDVLSKSIILFEEYGISILQPSLSDQQATVQIIPADTPLEILKEGKSLVSDAHLTGIQHGAFALIDNTWLPIII